MNDIANMMIQYAPAVAALLWIVYKQDKRLDEITETLIRLARDCDCIDDEVRE